MPKVSLDGDFINMGQMLCCPSCRSTYLHHETIEIFERPEDAAVVLHTTANEAVTTKLLAADKSENPSPRRHGLFITFSCEGCQASPVLDIFQHKGVTFMRWRACLTQ